MRRGCKLCTLCWLALWLRRLSFTKCYSQKYFPQNSHAQGQMRQTSHSPRDITGDSRDNPQRISVHLRCSKTDPFGAGCYIHLGRTNTIHVQLPQFSAISAFISQHRAHFLFQDGTPLTRESLVFHLRVALAQLELTQLVIQVIASVLVLRRHPSNLDTVIQTAAPKQSGYCDSDPGQVEIVRMPHLHPQISS